VQSNFLENSIISRNVGSSHSTAVSKDSNHTTGFDNNLVDLCKMNKQTSEPMELSIEDEIKKTTDKCDKTMY